MTRNRESVQALTVESGINSGRATFTPEAGKIIGCMIYRGDLNNTGIVRASVKDSSGDKVSELQHIDNYRSREAAYYQGFKPLNLNGGTPVTFEVIATENFTADFTAELILVYEPEEISNCQQ